MQYQRSHVYAKNNFFRFTQAHKLTKSTILMTDSWSGKKIIL